MKLQIAFDLQDLPRALSIAQATHEHADILEIGGLLLCRYGAQAIRSFREQFPDKTILADAKIADYAKGMVGILAEAGADWVTVLAGSGKKTIHSACAVAHELGKKVILDLLDASSAGQTALEAKSLGADALLFRRPDDQDGRANFSDRWDMVKGNTGVPIFIASNITRENIAEILTIGASGVIIGKAITAAENPAEEAAYFSNMIRHTS